MSRSSKKVLLFEVAPISPHIETTVEVGFKHLELGDTVFLAPIFKVLPYLEFGNNEFISVEKRLVKILDYYRSISPIVSNWCLELPDDPNLLNGTTELDPGIVSTLKWATRSNDLEKIFLRKKAFVDQVFKCSLIASSLARFYLEKYRPSVCYVFNGRFASSFAIYKTCENYKIPCLFHERGCDKDHYEIFEKFIQSFSNYNERISREVEHLSDIIIDSESRKFFTKKRSPTPSDWPSFLPTNSTNDEYEIEGCDYITFFTSADFEMGAFIENADAGLGDQLEALRYLIQACSRANKRLVVRFHPNSKESVDNLPMYNILKEHGIIYYDAYSQVDSYYLMENSEIVFTYGSTIGIEASFWGKPSYSLSRYIGIYSAPGSVIKSLKEIEEVILLPKVDPALYNFARKYGCYMWRYGIEFEVFKFNSFFSSPSPFLTKIFQP